MPPSAPALALRVTTHFGVPTRRSGIFSHLLELAAELLKTRSGLVLTSAVKGDGRKIKARDHRHSRCRARRASADLTISTLVSTSGSMFPPPYIVMKRVIGALGPAAIRRA